MRSFWAWWSFLDLRFGQFVFGSDRFVRVHFLRFFVLLDQLLISVIYDVVEIDIKLDQRDFTAAIEVDGVEPYGGILISDAEPDLFEHLLKLEQLYFLIIRDIYLGEQLFDVDLFFIHRLFKRRV